MTAQEDALAQIAALLDAERVPYMVIGRAVFSSG